MSKDFFNKPFGDSTMMKLSLFEDYLSSWLYVFSAGNKILCNKINIFDFFAGQGKDKEGVEGSPIRIIREVLKKRDFISEKNIKVTIYLNEIDKKKFNSLSKLIAQYQNEKVFKIVLTKVHFSDLFYSYYSA